MPEDRKTLGELCCFDYGASLPAKVRTEGNIFVVGSAGHLGWHNTPLVTGPGIVIGRKGTVGKATWVSGDFWPIDTTYYVRPRDGVDLRWLYFLLDFLPLKSLDNSTGVPGLNRNDAYKLHIGFFPREVGDQKLIADILDAIDNAIIETDTVIDKLLAIRIGLTEDLLTLGITKNGQRRSLCEIAETKLGPVPQSWTSQPLGSLAEVITSGSRGWAKYYSETGAKFLRIGNLTREHINLRLDDLVFVTPPNGQEGSRTAVRTNDLLISITADLGIIGSIPPEFGEAYVNQHVALVRLKESEVSPRWPAHFLSSRRSQLLFQRLNDQGAKAGINLPAVAQIEVPLPPRDEQDAIVERLDAVDEKVARFRVERQKLAALRLGLREDLLTGRKSILAVREAAK